MELALMSEWTSRISNHRIWESMKALGPVIDKAATLDDAEPLAEEALDRLSSVLAFCGKRLGGTPPELLLATPLDPIASAFDSQRTEVEAYISDKNIAHLTTANNLADTVLTNLNQFPGALSPEELVGLNQVINRYRAALEDQERTSIETRRKANSELTGLVAAGDALRTQSQADLTALKAQIEAERQKILTQTAEHQKLFTEAQTSRGATYNETVLKIQESLAKTLSDQQGQFSTAQENRGREFAATQTDAQKRFGDLIADHTKRLAEQDAEFTKQRDALVAASREGLANLGVKYELEAKNVLDEVNTRRSEVEKLVGVIGSLGVTSGYQKTAQNARLSMWVWQGITVVAMGVLIFFAYHAFLSTTQGDFRWPAFAGRVFLTITVGVLAAYGASQADRFFQMEKYNRKLSLELAAIDPFTALWSPDDQYKFKLAIGQRSFAQDEAPSYKDQKSPATAIDVLASKEGQQVAQLFVDLTQKILKGAKEV
jgi:hypothetical protein